MRTPPTAAAAAAVFAAASLTGCAASTNNSVDTQTTTAAGVASSMGCRDVKELPTSSKYVYTSAAECDGAFVPYTVYVFASAHDGVGMINATKSIGTDIEMSTCNNGRWLLRTNEPSNYKNVLPVVTSERADCTQIYGTYKQ